MSEVREVMYVGRKPKKADNVSGKPSRIWNGLGDVQPTTPLEAIELSKHPLIWLDVTGWDENKRLKVVERVRGEMREEARRHTRVVPLHLATEDELLEQLRKLKQPVGALHEQSELKEVQKNVPARRAKAVVNQDTGDEATRPKTSKEVVDAIVGAIMTMDVNKVELFDSEQHPTQEAIEAILGYRISESERRHALAALKG